MASTYFLFLITRTMSIGSDTICHPSVPPERVMNTGLLHVPSLSCTSSTPPALPPAAIKSFLTAPGTRTMALAPLRRSGGIFIFGIAAISLTTLDALLIFTASFFTLVALLLFTVSSFALTALLALTASSIAMAAESDMQYTRDATMATTTDLIFLILSLSPFSKCAADWAVRCWKQLFQKLTRACQPCLTHNYPLIVQSPVINPRLDQVQAGCVQWSFVQGHSRKQGYGFG